MTLEPSAWRANDSVSFDLARDAVNTAVAMLYRLVDEGAMTLDTANTEVAAMRRELLTTDAFNREAIENLTRRVSIRLSSLDGTAR